MLLFIDTNVLLSFLHFSNEDLGKLDQLVILAGHRKLDLVLPQQVKDEYTRRREDRIADALKQMKEAQLATTYAQICRHYPEYKELQGIQQSFVKARTALIQKVTDAASRNELHADRTITQLFTAGRVVERNPEILSAARERHELGNPPGKRDSLGDAVNWETLLVAADPGSDLHLVSDDKDWTSALDREVFSPFLANEWQHRKQGQVKYYQRLTKFFADNFPDIRLASELEKDLLVKDLAESPSYKDSHRIIQALSTFSDFTRTQLNDIVSAYISNDQVSFIARDSDLRRFIESAIGGHEHELDPTDLVDLQAILAGENPYVVGQRRLAGLHGLSIQATD